jgi:hypothetical protein
LRVVHQLLQEHPGCRLIPTQQRLQAGSLLLLLLLLLSG